METSEVEEKIYSALKNNNTIMGLLPNGESSIFHLQAPETSPAYPILVYRPISDDPILHCDNQEYLHRVTIRIQIITIDGNYTPLYLAIKKLMAALDFTRLHSVPIVQNGKKLLTIDFKKIVGA